MFEIFFKTNKPLTVLYRLSHFFKFRSCKQIGGPKLPNVDDCLADTDPCNVSIIFFCKLTVYSYFKVSYPEWINKSWSKRVQSVIAPDVEGSYKLANFKTLSSLVTKIVKMLSWLSRLSTAKGFGTRLNWSSTN